MVKWIVKKYVKDYENTKDIEVKTRVGYLCGAIGMINNLFLFAIKFLIGMLVHSISIQADGINNLTDAVSNIVSIFSFQVAKKPADEGHPYGHERFEVIASLFVAFMVAFLGFETAKESIENIIHQEPLHFRWITVLVLVISILVKLWMYSYNKQMGKDYDSSMLMAVSMDSISDVLGTSALLISLFISKWTGFNLDGYMGIVVSCIILWGAFNLLRDVINTLIGKPPQKETIEELADFINQDEKVLGVHDVLIHNYGLDTIYASAHVEVDSQDDLLDIHQHIDSIEREVKEKFNIELVLHMDPKKIDDPITERYEKQVQYSILKINPEWKYHDFRVIKNQLIFDLVIPFDEKREIEEIKTEILKNMEDKDVELDITLDHPYV